MNSSLPAHNQDGNKDYKAAGVAIPVFSLRSKNSSGIGEFSDLKKLADWAHITKQSFIQVLPINDTTMTYTRHDSYPYNAITSFALHPIYLGLHEYPLKNEELSQKYKKKREKLNVLPEVDYDCVIKLKTSYIKDLFAEIGQETLKNEDFLAFYDKNQEWLFPYACFSYFRDLYNTADSSKWEIHRNYEKKELEKLSTSNSDMKGALDIVYFTQYLLHKQLVAVKDYAHQKGVKLKGDIPIGISRTSVEAWTEPQLLNLDTQAGAPPDDFAIHGQNWGFPTYNWEEMEKEGFQWWIKRFRKMADYFDAYRIDHLLGFFRIWEIPASSIHALLGYFSPALPLSVEEIRAFGIEFDEERMTKPYIHQDFLEKIFGEYTQEVKEKYLEARKGTELFDLKQEFNTQVKIRDYFGEADDKKTSTIRDGFFDLCNEVLFIRDKKEKDKFHPRIAAKRSYTFKALSEQEQKAFTELDEEFCNNRHTKFWQDQAMKKLPILVHSTEMLACAEDLGMIPASVPPVMKELKLISLEIERMPKTPKRDFADLTKLPYLSVCTTSSHDINPIRAWWLEDKERTQKYYDEVLEKEGLAPEECTTEICEQILKNHLKSPSMLAIFPLQDWLAIDSRLRRDDPKKERINIPGIADHYWRYRMHLNLEELTQANDFNSRIKALVEESSRG